MMTLSPSTASYERGFSISNILKTDERTRLNQNNLKNQLLLMTEGPPVSELLQKGAYQSGCCQHQRGNMFMGTN